MVEIGNHVADGTGYDTNGRKYVTEAELAEKLQTIPWLFTQDAADTKKIRVAVDTLFTCVKSTEPHVVYRDGDGPFIRCSHGRHYLSGQLDFNGGGYYVGVYWPTEAELEPKAATPPDAAG